MTASFAKAARAATAALTLCVAAPNTLAEPGEPQDPDELALPAAAPSGSVAPGQGFRPPRTPPPGVQTSPRSDAVSVPAEWRLAQFQLAPAGTREGDGPARQRAQLLAQELDFQYTWGSDTEYSYDRDVDLNNRRRDNLQFLAPTVFFLMAKRPTPWLTLNFGATAEQQFRIHEEQLTLLPDGSREPAQRRAFTAKVDVANVAFRNIADLPVEVSFGRMTFEDPRLTLYDLTLDGIHVRIKGDTFVTEASVTREDQWDFTFLQDLPKSTIKNYILYHEYRGIEDHKIAAYAIARLDRVLRSEGRFKLYGVRAYGRPWDEFNYWAEFGVSRGVDEARVPQPLRGNAHDLGFTYRYPDLPMAPCLTFARAYGSGDADSRDGVNREYRQTGMQSNETKFCGVAQFKRYGEFIDPEISNLRIYTLGIGFRPTPNVYVDLVHHEFRLNHIATDVRNGQISAQMNRFAGRTSLNVGRELDVIVAFRRLLGTKWGIDLRTGVFFPGSAYLRRDGTNANPIPVDPNKGLRLLLILSY
jgi:alginate production protein